MKALIIGGTGPTGPFIVNGLLERGYAVALHEGRAVRDPAQLSAGAVLTVQVHGGEIDAAVTELRPKAP